MMIHKWFFGTAAAALVASGAVAVAQDADFAAADPCRFEAMAGAGTDMREGWAALDRNQDERISRDEYMGCLSAHGIDLNAQALQKFENEFDKLDSDGDGVMVVADVEPLFAASETAAETTKVAVKQQAASVTVTQPAATITIKQAPPEVIVRQPEPQVAVTQQEPEVSVRQPEPEVTVQQVQPKVAVAQPDPKVTVNQPEPKVTIAQREPEVTVRQGRPKVAVAVAEPEVAVSQPEPEVAVSQAEPKVSVSTEQPKVAVKEAEAEVDVQRVAEVTPKTAAKAGAKVETVKIDVVAIEDRELYDARGEEIGEVEAIRLDPQTNTPVLIVEVGGFLGLGEKEIVVAYQDVTVEGDRLVLRRDVEAKKFVDEQRPYDEARYQDLPQSMIE